MYLASALDHEAADNVMANQSFHHAPPHNLHQPLVVQVPHLGD